MSSNQQPRPFFRLGSFRPMQTTPQPPPPPAPAPQASIIRPAVPRFRTTATQTPPPQETVLVAPPRQIGPPAAAIEPAPPSTTVAQPQVPLTIPALNAPAPAPSTTPAAPTPSASLPSIVAVPLIRPPPMQPNLATPKPVSPQPRFVASPIPSSPTTKTETVTRSSPKQAAVAAALLRAPPTQPNPATSKPLSPQPRFVAPSTPPSSTTKTETVMRSSPQRTAVAPPRFPTDKSPTTNSIPQSPTPQPKQTITSVTYASPTRESSTLENSFIKKPYPEPSKTPTTTSPVRKVSLPSPQSKTALGSRSPPPSEPLPTAAQTSIVPDGHTPSSPPRNGNMLSKTPTQSPLIRPLSRPPSPLTLPPAQIKTAINHEPNTLPKDQTTVTTHERDGKPKAIPRVTDTYEFVEATYKYIGQDGEGKDMHKKKDEAGQSGMNVIRLAGENHGAIMELTPSSTKENINGRKTEREYGKGNEEESSNTKNNKSMAIEAPPLTAFMNSNVQGMNNSIVYNTSCTHNDPGVHLSFSRKPNGGYVKDNIME